MLLGLLGASLSGCAILKPEAAAPRFRSKDKVLNPQNEALQLIEKGSPHAMYNLIMRTPFGTYSYDRKPIIEADIIDAKNTTYLEIPPEFRKFTQGQESGRLFEIALSESNGKWNVTYHFFNGDRGTSGQQLGRRGPDYIFTVEVPDSALIEQVYRAKYPKAAGQK